MHVRCDTSCLINICEIVYPLFCFFFKFDALTQLMQKKNRVESLEDGKVQREVRSYTCSICHKKGHNQKTCKQKLLN